MREHPGMDPDPFKWYGSGSATRIFWSHIIASGYRSTCRLVAHGIEPTSVLYIVLLPVFQHCQRGMPGHDSFRYMGSFLMIAALRIRTILISVAYRYGSCSDFSLWYRSAPDYIVLYEVQRLRFVPVHHYWCRFIDSISKMLIKNPNYQK